MSLKVFFHNTKSFTFFENIIDSLKKGDSFDIYVYSLEKIKYIDKKLSEKNLKCSYYGKNCTVLIF